MRYFLFFCALSSIGLSQSLTLTWTDNSDNETGFGIERSTDGATFAEIAQVGTNVETYQDTSISYNTTYWYRVRAYNAAGNSGYTNTASGLSPASGDPPTPPQGVIIDGIDLGPVPSLLSLEGYFESNWTDTAANEVTPTVSWLSGDLICVVATTENSNYNVPTPTGGGLNFALERSTNVSNNCNVYLWTTIAQSNGSSQISSLNGSTGGKGIGVFVFSGSSGIGNVQTYSGVSNLTRSLTRSQPNSTVIAIMGDWVALNDTSVTAVPTGVVDTAAYRSGAYTVYVMHYENQGAAGSTNYGIGSHTGTGQFSFLIAEILD